MLFPECCRVFVDVVNGEYIPRKSILKSRSRENSVCSDTSESSAADVDVDRRAPLRSPSSEETTGTEAGGSTVEELQENHPKKPVPSGVSEVRVSVLRFTSTDSSFTF